MRGVKNPPTFCQKCGAQTKHYTRKFCSTACSGASMVVRPILACATCGGSTQRRGLKFCSNRCASIARFPTAERDRPCEGCGGALQSSHERFCCLTCYRTASAPTPAWTERMAPLWDKGASLRVIAAECGVAKETVREWARKLNLPPKVTVAAKSGPETLISEPQAAVIRQLYPVFTAFEVIKAQVNALPGAELRTPSQFEGWLRRLGVRRDPEIKREVARQKATEAWERRRKGKPARIVAQRRESKPPIRLRLREVYQWGAALELPLDQRGDIAAVNAAMRREDPAHRGFALADRATFGFREAA